jgi:hypothetical protein
MDDNYLYIVCTLAFIVVFFIFFIYFKTRSITNNSGFDEPKNDLQCDGDKCFIKHRQTANSGNRDDKTLS